MFFFYYSVPVTFLLNTFFEQLILFLIPKSFKRHTSVETPPDYYFVYTNLAFFSLSVYNIHHPIVIFYRYTVLLCRFFLFGAHFCTQFGIKGFKKKNKRREYSKRYHFLTSLYAAKVTIFYYVISV